jgi:hypothetical protein
MAIVLRRDYTSHYCTLFKPGLLGYYPQLDARLHLESTKPRHQAELPGSSHVQGAVVTVGPDCFQRCAAQPLAQG